MTSALVHLVQGDVPSLLEDAVALDFLPDDVDRARLLPVLERIFHDAKLAAASAPRAEFASVKRRRKEFAAVSGDLNDVFFNYEFRVPDYFALITRALIILEGIALSADPDFDIFQAAYPHALRHARAIFGDSALAAVAASASLQAAHRQRPRLVPPPSVA